MTSQSSTYLFNTGSQRVAAVDDRSLHLDRLDRSLKEYVRQQHYLKEDLKIMIADQARDTGNHVRGDVEDAMNLSSELMQDLLVKNVQPRLQKHAEDYAPFLLTHMRYDS
jgi:hypothetical protein